VERARIVLLAASGQQDKEIAARMALRRKKFRAGASVSRRREWRGCSKTHPPTSASWLNMVERFFRDLTQNRLRRVVFRDLEELIMAIGTYIDRHKVPNPLSGPPVPPISWRRSNAPAEP
jgi:hypothetical protein